MRDPDVLSFQAWSDAWRAIGTDGGDGDIHRQLLTRYAEPQRHYHTAQHLAECFERLHDAMHEAEHPGEVLVALWFHDAIYDPKRHDNEQQSADWARDAISTAGLASEVAARVHMLIMATRHDGVERYETLARANLTRSLDALSA